MKLNYDRKSPDPTYFVQHGFRNESGKPTTKNIKRIGKHSQLLKDHPDPLEYAKQVVKQMNEEMRNGRVDLNIEVNLNEKLLSTDMDISKSTSRNIGYFFLQYIYNRLELDKFFKQICKGRKMTFDCNDVNRFLTYSRILDPQSKYATCEDLERFYEKPDIDYQHIMRFMDLLQEHFAEYIKWNYKKSNNIVPRDSAVMYYDCTNFYCETEQADEDIVDEVTGEVIRGFREYGPSKENRPNPIVEMGLLMDRRGIPVTMCLHPGNTSEQLTAIPLEEEVIRLTGSSKFIYCADAGLGSYNIRKFNSMGGRAFIVTQSVKKLSDKLKEAVFNDYDYRLLSNDESVSVDELKTFDKNDENKLPLYNDKAYKKIRADQLIDLGLYEEKENKNGTVRKVKAKGTMKQYVIVTYSRKMAEYQKTIRMHHIERAKKLMENNDPENIKKGPNDVRRFLKRQAVDKDGNNARVSYVLDEEKIREEEKYDGYYAVATNLEDDPKDIMEVISYRYKVEDCFRILKSNFNARPIYHYTENRIRSHFLICYTALLIYRLLECLLDDNGTHVTTGDLIETLKNMNIVDLKGLCYMSAYTGSKTLDALDDVTKLGLGFKYYTPKDLNLKLKKK